MRSRLYIVLIGVWAMLFQACSNDALIQSEVSDTELATVNIRVSTRANGGADTNMDANEGIKALRVIVLDENWKILDNWYREGLGGAEGKTEEQTITLQLPRTKVRFLAIANEKSMGRSFDTASLMEDFSNEYENNGLKNILNRAWDNETPAFPQTAATFSTFSDVEHTISIKTIAEFGLPMTGIKGGYDILTGAGSGTGTGGHHDYNSGLYMDTKEENSAPIDLTNATSIDIEIPLVRCVSKIVVNVTNAMAQDLTIQSVNFGRFFTNKVYYYAHSPLHLPGEIRRTRFNFIFNTPESVPSNEQKEVFVGYIFPTAIPNMSSDHLYTIALGSNVEGTNSEQVFFKKGDAIEGETTDIPRNSLITINCTVNLHELTVISDLELWVLPWKDAGDMDDIIFN